jgi:predicted ferric reductase
MKGAMMANAADHWRRKAGNLTVRKILLLGVLSVTCLAPLAFVRLDEPTLRLNLFKLLAKTGSLCGTMLLAWQFLLGYRQGVARWVTPDYLWTIELHKYLGMAALPLVLLHPVFIVPYYRIKLGLRPVLGWAELPATLRVFVPLGIAALIVLAVVAVTSTVFRSKMSRAAWYWTHLSAYLLLPLALVHGFPIGQTIGQTPLRWVWAALFALTALFFVFRVLGRLGLFDAVYEVTRAEHTAHQVVELSMSPLRRPLRPAAAQFAFFRRGLAGTARPFTISNYDPDTGRLSITVKAMGSVSGDLQQVEPGERFLVDGPYGIFGREAFTTERPVVMLAGGIGITPFRRLIQELEKLPDGDIFLFYGNQYEKDIAHGGEMEAARHVNVTHVLSGHEEHNRHETGFITIELLREHLPYELPDCEFFLCGPPVMIKKLEAELRAEGAPERQIHHELFTY